jgi:uncharacterized delta-60 repeat protein
MRICIYPKPALAALAILLFLAGGVMAADGDLDESFSPPNGYAIWDSGSVDDRARDLALTAEGKLVIAGYQDDGSNEDIFAVQLNADGSLDTDFASSGVYTYDSGLGDDVCLAVAVLESGKILIAGYRANGTDGDVMVARLNADGSLDTSFATNGIFSYDSGAMDAAQGMAVASDGRILLTGFTYNGADNDLFLMRLTAEGALDTSFNTTGIVTYDSGSGHDWGGDLALTTAGKIVVTGMTNSSSPDLGLWRFNADGSLDTGFDTDGAASYDGGDYDAGRCLILQEDGKILVSGVSAKSGVSTTDYDIPLIRFNSDGSLDTGFGTDGVARFDNNVREQGYDLALQSDGKILLTGHSGSTSDWGLEVLRYTSEGALDTDFGTAGRYTYDLSGSIEWGYALAITAEGNPLVVGQVQGSATQAVIALRLENGADDTDDEPASGNPTAGGGSSGGGCFLSTLEVSHSP